MADKTDKNKVLVLMDSYYPDPRATTFVMQQIIESFPKSVEVYVFTLNLLNRIDKSEKISVHNGVKIEYAEKIVYPVGIKRYFYRLRAKVLDFFYKKMYGIPYKFSELFLYSKQVASFMKANGIKKMISVASPNDVHICADMVVSRNSGVDWYPVSFDPHAYDERYPSDWRKKLIKEELILYKRAKRIFFLAQSEKDYIDSLLNEKITYIELPIIYRENIFDHNNASEKKRAAANEKLKIMYIGSLYKNIRNPDHAFDLFSKIENVDFKLYVVGGFSGWNEELETYLDKSKQRAGDRIEFTGRLSREEVEKYFSEADVFVNIGNTTHNQCPSKVLELIATGKPIVHFKKIDDCTSLRYLDKYPNVCVLDERDQEDKNLSLLTAFLSENIGKRVDVDTLKKLYRENEISYISDIISAHLN